jgi:hypothetical protein
LIVLGAGDEAADRHTERIGEKTAVETTDEDGRTRQHE